MKVVLTAINAKYIHSNLAVYSLRAYAKQYKDEIEIAEYTINQQLDDILMDLYKRKPDVLCFSCYIWNLTQVEELIREIRKIFPSLPIWVGGPEVSYDAKDVLKRLPEVTGVMFGEGEETFLELLRYYHKGEKMLTGPKDDLTKQANGSAMTQIDDDSSKEVESDTISTVQDSALASIAGIAYRNKDGNICQNEWRKTIDLSTVPFVYHDMADFKNKIVYYESSRGCPFSCSYCLSSVDKCLRFRDVELVKKELQFFIDAEVPQVKFVDRTFNCNHKHAMEIWTYLMEHDKGITNFHFEVAADLLNEEEIQLIGKMRPGLIQLEIGVQSTNEETIREIRRTMKFPEVARIVNRINQGGNVHQHLDLIAGLPYEDLASFQKSFDDVYGLHPEQLQLGFLKVLKGSYMEEKKQDYGLVYKSNPPYEVLYTNWLSYADVLVLKMVEEMVEVYYNSGQFSYTLRQLEQEFDSAFALYMALGNYYEKHELHLMSHSRITRYEILLDFIRSLETGKEDLYRELLTFDLYLRENVKNRPEFAGEYKVSKEEMNQFYEVETEQHQYLKNYEQYDKRQLRKMTHIEKFQYDVLGDGSEKEIKILFDYENRSKLTHQASIFQI
ncbi:MAG: B12-binding domain-containing radical SAM protein [Tyzzerella sp.]|nr:B12-binding domain-containing radical SAM protein [Tyzzerella sp.]